MYGYDVRRDPVSEAKEINPNAEVKHLVGHPVDARPVACSLFCPILGAVPPMPDTKSASNAIAGAKKRFIRALPSVEPEVLESIGWFVDHHILPHINHEIIGVKEEFDSPISLLASSHYSDSRKAQLLREFLESPSEIANEGGASVNVQWYKHLKNKSFIKTEHYTGDIHSDEYKAARLINSRSDAFKVAFAPYFKHIENVLYHSKLGQRFCPFVKGVSREYVPEYIQSNLGGLPGRYVGSDHTAFEAHMIPEIMRVIELKVYKYILSSVPGGDIAFRVIEAALAGRNECNLKMGNDTVTVRVDGVRMSGDLCTSVGNGITNYVIAKYVPWAVSGKMQDPHQIVEGCVEGDDGIFRMMVEPPTVEQFIKCGFEVKLTEAQTVGRVGFLKMFWNEFQSEGSYENIHQVEAIHGFILNPAEVLSKIGWTSSNRRNTGHFSLVQLRLAKAMSLYLESVGCPIIHKFAIANLKYALSSHDDYLAQHPRAKCITDKHKCQFAQMLATQHIYPSIPQLLVKAAYCEVSDRLFRTDWRNVEEVEISIEDRNLMAEIFGVTVADQFKLETHFTTQWKGNVMSDLILNILCADYPLWQRYFDAYVVIPRN